MTKKTQSRQSIEELRERFDTLNTQRIKLQTQKETADERMAELKQQARDQFGTDDLTELQEKLAEMKARNEAQLAAYQDNLDQIEQKLLEIDEAFEEADEPVS